MHRLKRSVWPGLSLLFVLLPALASAQEAARDLEQIRSCARANMPDSSFSQKVELSSWDKAGGERALEGRLYGEKQAENRMSLMLSLDQPRDLAGARYLLVRKKQRDDMYVYLPAVKRTRRIMGGMRGQPLWGTDFSYEDIKQLQLALTEGDTEYLGDGKIADRTVHQLRVIPLADAESAYTAIEIDIDQQTCLLRQARFFDSSGVFKRMDNKPEAFSQNGQRWVAGEVQMENLRSGTHSLLKLANYSFDEDLQNTRFSPQSFHLAR